MPILLSAAFIGGGGLLAALLIALITRLGGPGRAIGNALTRAPMLDVVVSLFTWVPWVVGLSVWGWRGLLGSILAQFVGLHVWNWGHELLHRDAVKGPRIVRYLNAQVGWWRNHLALWVTAVSLPAFVLIRAAELFLYPWLVILLRFPRYRQAEWVNVSRQKFEGLVGHDLIWCLYCDWMTGVYSLGAEMLRNVESFWCPIRFYDGKKCENCTLDFPDVDGGWVAPDGTMGDVVATLEEKYGDGRREWFGHPARLTVNGADVG